MYTSIDELQQAVTGVLCLDGNIPRITDGRGAIPATSTVPAINLRALTYDIARVLFKLTQQQHIGPWIVELARSEMEYTDQRYEEFTVAVLAAAIKEGYRGPLFLQADMCRQIRITTSKTLRRKYRI
jgi:hypothetical protein